MTTNSLNNDGAQVRLFPPGMDTASDDEKKCYFQNVRIDHARLTTAIKEITRLLDAGFNKSLIFLTGPAGVGKSVASGFLVANTNRKFFEMNPENRTTVPAILLEAWAPEKGNFDWADLYEEALHELQIPLIEDTLPIVRREIFGGTLETPMVEFTGKIAFRDLRRKFRKAIKQRAPTLIAIDEGSNILTVEASDPLKRQANTLKSIVNKSGTRLLVTGAYDLFALSVQSGQLTRRAAVVHFEPYSYKELESFLVALLTLQNHMPLEKPVDLTPYAEELFRQSLGCIGLLATILYNALDLALQDKGEINRDILKKSFFKPFQLAQLKMELADGYRMVEGREFFKTQKSQPEAKNDAANRPASVSKQQRVGQRAPARDQTAGGSKI